MSAATNRAIQVVGSSILFATCVLFTPARAAIVYLDADATNANNGTSWVDAYTNLQDAITGAVPGTEIWVAEGTYLPGQSRDSSFSIPQGVALYGGFSGVESNRDERAWDTYSVTLSGDVGTSGVSTDNCYHVVGMADSARLDGFTVSDGRASGNSYPDTYGAGLLVTNGSPLIVNCRFQANQALPYGSGGGICVAGGSPTVSNCSFVANWGYWGGGIACLSGEASIADCSFVSNRADFGAGVHTDSATSTIRRCVFDANGGDGAGVHNRAASVVVAECVFINGSGRKWDAGGIRNIACSPTIENCVIVANSAPKGNGAGLFTFAGSPSVLNCTIGSNVAIAPAALCIVRAAPRRS